MPLDFSNLRDLLQQKKQKLAVAPAIQAEAQDPPAIPAPAVEAAQPPMPAPQMNPAPKMQPVGDTQTAQAPRFDEVNPSYIGGGKLVGPEEEQYLRSKGMVRPKNDFSFGDRLKSALKTALPGLAQGGIGGAIAGAIGGAVDPRQGSRYQFETWQQPGIDAANARQQKEASQRAAITGQQAESAYKTAQAGHLDAQAALDAAKTANEGALIPLQQQKLQSDIDYNRAKTEAAKTGQPQKYDIKEDDGSISTYQVFADGTQTWVGKSGAAAIHEADRQSRETESGLNRANSRGIAGMHEAGADRRQGRSEAAQDRRANLKQNPEAITEDEFEQLLSAPEHKGLTREQVHEKYKRKGFIVPE